MIRVREQQAYWFCFKTYLLGSASHSKGMPEKGNFWDPGSVSYWNTSPQAETYSIYKRSNCDLGSACRGISVECCVCCRCQPVCVQYHLNKLHFHQCAMSANTVTLFKRDAFNKDMGLMLSRNSTCFQSLHESSAASKWWYPDGEKTPIE